MPTVRSDIDPLILFPAPKGKSDSKALRVYPAEAWEKWGGKPGRYRVQIGEAWVARPGEGKSFFTWAGVEELLLSWARKAAGQPAKPRGLTPEIPVGSLVHIRLRDVAEKGDEASVAGRTRGRPFQDASGEWRVYVYGCKAPVLLEDLTPRKRGEGFDLAEGSDGIR